MKFFVLALSSCLLLACQVAPKATSPGTKQQTEQGLNIQTWQTNNATRVYYVHAPQLPMVDVRVVFDAGSARDGDKPGLASLTNLLLDNGAGKWNTNQISERFDNVGAQFGASVGRDMAQISLRSLTDKELFTPALQTMQAILQKPHFKKSEFTRERKRVLVGLRNQQESPSTIAELAFFKALYQQHPYATPRSGTEESVKRISRQDLLDFYQQYYVANNAIVVIVGAVERKQAEQIANQLTAALPKGKSASALPAVATIEKARRVQKQHPSSQTHIWVGQEGNYRGDPDYFALYVGNHILGGSGFGSRVVTEIREQRGLAYSSYTYFAPLRRKGPFLMGLQTRNDQAEQALQVLNQTLATFIKEGPTEAELVDAKKYITGCFPLRIDSNKDIMEYVAVIGFYQLPLDYLQAFNRQVEKVTREQIKDAFQRRIHPQSMVTVLVGDMAK